MFGFNINVEACIMELKLGNQIVQKQQLQAPAFVIQQNFIDLCQQIMQDSRPLKLKLYKYETIWDDFDKCEKQIENAIEYANEIYLKNFPNEFKGSDENA